MAKKKTTKKAGGAAAKKRSTSKAATKKSTAKKATTKKPAAKKVTKKTTKKPAAKKAPAKKAVTKKAPSKKVVSKKVTSKKAPEKKAPAKSPAPSKQTTKKAPAKPETKAPASKQNEKAASDASAKGGAQDPKADDKSGRKGITIVSKKRTRVAKKVVTSRIPAIGFSGLPTKPMIPSGPKNKSKAKAAKDDVEGGLTKSPFKKRELNKYRDILLRKREELIGDVAELEDGALRGNSGSLSRLPQHSAEQGSEAADQSLSLNLAAHERRIIEEIDAALQRIDDGVYGICEETGRPIKPERLEEIPWARLSIMAAQQLESSGRAR